MATGEGEGTATYLLASVPLRTAVEGARVALAILAVQAMDDVALGGLLIAAFTAPTVLAAPLVGAAVDRARRPVLLVAAAALVVAAALIVAAGLGPVPPPVVAAVLVAAGLGSPVFLGALSSFAPEVVRHSSARAFAVDALSYNIAGIGGPALVGVVAAASSARTAMLVLGGVAVLGAVALIPVRLAARADGTSAGLFGEMRRGIRHLSTHRPLALTTLAGTASQLGAGALPVVAVAIALERGDSAEQASWLVTAMAVGGIVGAGITAWRPVPGRSDRVMCAGLALTGAGTLLAAVAPTVPLTALALALSGLSTAPTVVALFRIRQEESPEGVRSQVFTVGSALRVVAAAIGAAAIGFVADLPAGALAALIGLAWLLSAVPLLFAYAAGEEPGERLTPASAPPAPMG